MAGFLLTSSALTKVYGKQTAVESIDIHVPEGSIYGLIGRNGAGKTTFLRMISGMSRPTSGSFSYSCGNKEAMNIMGSLIEEPALVPSLSAFDNLKLKAIAYGIPGDQKQYINDLLEKLGLTDVAAKPAGKFSLGMRQRLGVALALTGDPKILILDEPINGLDPQGIADMRKFLISLAKDHGKTIIISSHILEELHKVMTDFSIIDKGRIVVESTAAELDEELKACIEIQCDDPDKLAGALREEGFDDFAVKGPSAVNLYGCNDRVEEINMKLVQKGIMIKSIFVRQTDLEEYFFKKTGDGKSAG